MIRITETTVLHAVDEMPTGRGGQSISVHASSPWEHRHELHQSDPVLLPRQPFGTSEPSESWQSALHEEEQTDCDCGIVQHVSPSGQTLVPHCSELTLEMAK